MITYNRLVILMNLSLTTMLSINSVLSFNANAFLIRNMNYRYTGKGIRIGRFLGLLNRSSYQKSQFTASSRTDFDSITNSDNNNNDSPFGHKSPFSISTKSNPNEFANIINLYSSKQTSKLPDLDQSPPTKTLSNDDLTTSEEVSLLNDDLTTIEEVSLPENDDIANTINLYNSKRITPSHESDSSPKGVKKITKAQLKIDLKEYRMQQSASLEKPAYIVFNNAALNGILAALPTTKAELIEVKGIGPKKIEMFGDDIIEIVSTYTGSKGKNSNSALEGIGTTRIPQPTLIDPESLTAEQRLASDFTLGQEKRNVFITGSAGTGKSYLLKFIVQELQKKNNIKSNNVGVCAPTGVAAIIAGGSTLHSYFGIGLGTGSPSSLLRKVIKSAKVKNRINETDVLIIDECSMLSSDLLEKLDFITREVRNGGNSREIPFGGMQIIAFGDFFQLPPVYRGDSSGSDRYWRPFCFDSPVWSNLGLSENILELKEVQRQENEDFITLLNKVRIGQIQEKDIADLNSKCLISSTNPLPNDGIVPTRLYVLNKDVDSENVSRLAELKTEEVVCEAKDEWRVRMPVGTPAATKKKMIESLSMEMPDIVRLKVGAQVMLTRNKDLENNLVNGSRGIVESIIQPTSEGEAPTPIVRFDCGIVTPIAPVESTRYNPDGEDGCLVRMQIPLKLAWAITIHKSQGSTLTRAMLDITSAFEYGQCYVALSRVKSLEGLWLERPAKLHNIMVSPQVVDFFRMNRMNA